MKLKKLAATIAGTVIATLGMSAVSAAETFHVPGSACLLKRGGYSVDRDVSDLIVRSDWAEIICPIPRSTPITRIQVNTSGVAAGDPSVVGCVAGSGSYRRNAFSLNRYVYNGSSLGDVSCMLRRGDRVRSVQVTVR